MLVNSLFSTCVVHIAPQMAAAAAAYQGTATAQQQGSASSAATAKGSTGAEAAVREGPRVEVSDKSTVHRVLLLSWLHVSSASVGLVVCTYSTEVGLVLFSNTCEAQRL